MTDAGLDYRLDVSLHADRIAISAWVAADAPRALTWKMVASSRTRGGTSEVVQSGSTDGLRPDAVGSIAMSPDSVGCVILTVSEGGREIGRAARALGPQHPEADLRCR